MLYKSSFLVVIALCNLGWPSISAAQIKGDKTTGTVIKQQGQVSEITGGRQAGNNLFHSFKEFSVPSGAEAFFNNNKSVGNIFSRVTGGNISKIEGLIKANNANLILINPNGIIFSNGAQLQLGRGSFVGTTGDAVIFKDETSFSARDTGTPLLTISTPIGIKINNNPGAIKVSDSFLAVDLGQTLALIGGNIELNAGILIAPGGSIELGGLSQSGIVELAEKFNTRYPQGIERADVTISNFSGVDVASSLGGSININVKNLNISGLNAISAGTETNTGSAKIKLGNIDINATGSVEILGVTTITNTIPPNSQGEEANINITTSSLSLLKGAQINTIVYGSGKASNININALRSVIVDGVGEYDTPSAILSSVDKTGKGEAGSVNITADSLQVSNRANISSDTFGKGNAGKIVIIARSVIITNDGTVSAFTQGVGNAGKILIQAREKLILEGKNRKDEVTGVYSFVRKDGIGNGGNLEIKTQLLEVTNKAQINANTGGKGNAGNVFIEAKTITIMNRGQITSNTFSKGNAGQIFIEATNKLIIDGNNKKNGNTGVFSNVGKKGIGMGGNLQIVANWLEVTDAGRINAKTQGKGDAGNITITSPSVRLSNNVQIATSADKNTGSGGNITINADSILAYKNSDILAYSLTNQGGNVILNTPAFFGQGYFGNLKGNPEELNQNNRVDINATGQFSSGKISVPDLTYLQNALAELYTDVFDTNALIATSCLARSHKKQGSFVLLGSGSFSSQPGQASNSVYPTSSVMSVSPETSSVEKIKEAVEPLGVYQLENGEIILGRECE